MSKHDFHVRCFLSLSHFFLNLTVIYTGFLLSYETIPTNMPSYLIIQNIYNSIIAPEKEKELSGAKNPDFLNDELVSVGGR